MPAIHARTLLTLLVATAAMAAPISAAAAAKPLYDATRIETPDGRFIYAYGLTEDGTVVGQTSPPTSTNYRTVVWTAKKYHEYDPFGSDSSEALAVNATGDFVGVAQTPKDKTQLYAGWIHSAEGGFVELFPQTKYFETVADAINAGRAVAGWALLDEFQHRGSGFVWEDGVTTWLGSFDDGWSEPAAMNDAGTIVGQASYGLNTVPFQWSNDELVQLPDFGAGGGAWGINSSGVVVGCSWKTPTGECYPARWIDGVLDNLGTDIIGACNWVNDAGAVVGGIQNPRPRAVLWQGSTLTDLSKVVAGLQPGKALTQATRINNRGQILARANGVGYYYLLTPRK